MTSVLTEADKRSFFLMLSPQEGEELAKARGFFPASDDVQRIESLDTLSKWVVLKTSGCLDIAGTASTWLASFIAETNELEEGMEERYAAILYGYSAALLGLLMDKGVLDLAQPADVLQGLMEFSETLMRDFQKGEDDEQ